MLLPPLYPPIGIKGRIAIQRCIKWKTAACGPSEIQTNEQARDERATPKGDLHTSVQQMVDSKFNVSYATGFW